ncbi:MAG: HlyD family efflux transporter periplasmic adaptor subunit, partial [Holophagales bacterium]|nr:HlyD family efflux transporter periplasmic adaptor subunit [Holophagales bacterium]
ADITSLWLSVEVFEDQVVWIRPGAEAEVTFTYFPGETIRGTVEFIEPELSERTRTLTVKIAVPNPDGRLRKGMFGRVVFDPVLVRGALTILSESVLRTGRRSVVIVAQGGGRFEPREVELGQTSGGLAEVRSGLAAGESVVTSSQFLLDSESRLRAAVQQMLDAASAPEGAAQGHEGHEMSHEGHDMDGMNHDMDHGDHAAAEPEEAVDPHEAHGNHGR